LRLRQIPGIRPLIATAIVAAIGNGSAFRKGREFASWLGLVPRQHSTGGKARLLGISKRGNSYLRKILIHGARSAVVRMKRERAPLGAWLDALQTRGAAQRGGDRYSQQTGKNRLGCVVDRQRISSAPKLDSRIKQAWKRRLRLGKRSALSTFPPHGDG
jgi:hypothetical protein